MAIDAIRYFLADIYPPLPQSATFVEMCDNINRVEELPAFRKRREFTEQISNAYFVPSSMTGARITDHIPTHAERAINNFVHRVFFPK